MYLVKHIFTKYFKLENAPQKGGFFDSKALVLAASSLQISIYESTVPCAFSMTESTLFGHSPKLNLNAEHVFAIWVLDNRRMF